MSAMSDVYVKARSEIIALFGWNVDKLSPDQTLRLDCAVALRLALDDLQGRVVRGESIDVAKMLTAADALSRLLPPAALAAPPEEANAPDPRTIMWETYLGMRRRAVPAISEHGSLVDSLRASLIGLAEEIEAAGTTPLSHLPTPPAAAAAGAGNVVKLRDNPSRSCVAAPAAPPPQATPAYDYNTQSSWRDYVEPTGEIRSTPRGRWDV
jgi:hypothetical protein